MSEIKRLSLIGKGPQVIQQIVDAESFKENLVGGVTIDSTIGVSAMVGTGRIDGKVATLITNNAMATNKKYPVVYLGVIGLEEAYKMALAVYRTIEADKELSVEDKRPIILLVDTPGNGAGKTEEIIGMNKATAAYQLALAEGRKAGHSVIAVIIGRAISGGFLCHGLQADRILAMGTDYTTMIHVMPITSISRITKLDVERLEELSRENPVFASGVEYFYKLGGVEEIIETQFGIKDAVMRNAQEVTRLKAEGKANQIGPQHRGELGDSRGGRTARGKAIAIMESEFNAVSERYLK